MMHFFSGSNRMERESAGWRRSMGRYGGASLLVAGAVVAASSLWLSACDTVARIGFEDRRFNSVESSGLVPQTGSCGGSAGDARLRFVLLDDKSGAIKEGETIGLSTVNLTQENLEIGSSAIYSLPDINCTTNDGVMCPDGMTCGEGDDLGALGVGGEEYDRCYRSNQISLLEEPRFVSSVDKNHYFGLLVQHTGALDGWLPSRLDKYPDLDRDGVSDGRQIERPEVEERAADPDENRRGAVEEIVTNWRNVAANARTRNVEAFFGAWTFGETNANLTSVFDDENFVSEVSSVSDVSDDVVNITQSDRDEVAAVYESIERILDEIYEVEATGDVEKTLVVFVVGPDQLRDPDLTAQDVAARANELGVSLTFVHLDTTIETETEQTEFPLLVDDPRYYEEQSQCASDDDCKNFETCREPTWYADRANSTVKFPSNYMENPTYCLPERDANGRIGPIADYAEIACATGGSYIYVKGPSGLRSQIGWLPYAMYGQWEVGVRVEEIEGADVPLGDPYLVGASMSVNLDETERTVNFSQEGLRGTVIGGREGSKDTRPVLFTAAP